MNLSDKPWEKSLGLEGIIMKKLIFTLIFPLMLTGCFQQTQTVTGGGDDSTTDGGGGDFGWGTTNGSNGGTTGSWTNGSGGTNGSTNGVSYYPPIEQTFQVGGGIDWYPRNSNTPGDVTLSKCQNNKDSPAVTSSQCETANANLREEAMPTIAGANAIFQTDSRYKVRVTVLPQPVPPTANSAPLQNKIHCYGRNRGAPYIGPYESLRFDIGVRKITCTPAGSSNCTLGGTTYLKQTKTVSVNSSTIVDFSYGRPANDDAYALYIGDVRTHELYNGDLRSVASQSCWKMKIEISTDSTQDI